MCLRFLVWVGCGPPSEQNEEKTNEGFGYSQASTQENTQIKIQELGSQDSQSSEDFEENIQIFEREDSDSESDGEEENDPSEEQDSEEDVQEQPQVDTIKSNASNKLTEKQFGKRAHENFQKKGKQMLQKRKLAKKAPPKVE